MEENTERKVKCEKCVERVLEKRFEKMGACSHGRNLEMSFCCEEKNSRGVGLRGKAGSGCESSGG